MQGNDPFEGMDTTPFPPSPLRTKTFDFALRIIEFHDLIEHKGKILAGQVLRSGTSVGSQYREACRARSKAEFISKLESALQEADETNYWLELLAHSKKSPPGLAEELHAECTQVIKMMVNSVRTTKSGSGKRNV